MLKKSTIIVKKLKNTYIIYIIISETVKAIFAHYQCHKVACYIDHQQTYHLLVLAAKKNSTKIGPYKKAYLVLVVVSLEKKFKEISLK